MRPGDIITFDFRKGHGKNVPNGRQHALPGASTSSKPTIKAIQWNIERGYKLDEVIDLLKDHDADIICLQELDIGCERSGQRNCALEIAMALEMKCALLVEFEEIWSPLRSKALQGGGVHGNAIFSKYDFEARVLPHTHHPIDWVKEGERMGEPRRGERAILVAEVEVPDMLKPILCYSLHLEVFCGIYSRIRQFADVLEYAKGQVHENCYQMIFGDLNTMAHGIARLSPRYCRDNLRFMSLGYSEAKWWQENVLDYVADSNERANDVIARILPGEEHRLVNPYFFDPFSINKDTTLQGYCGIFCGKLDWTLLRGFQVIGKGMDNHGYSASDHKLLYVIVRPIMLEDQTDPGRHAYQKQHHIINHQKEYISSLMWTGLTTVLLATSAAVGIQYFLNK